LLPFEIRQGQARGTNKAGGVNGHKIESTVFPEIAEAFNTDLKDSPQPIGLGNVGPKLVSN
jgi:hypothetical protein